MVQGHVDEAWKILKFTREGASLWVKISLTDDLLPYVVPKGYIAVDGTSLTVCEVNPKEKWFNLMMIAHTQQCVIMPPKKEGELVNLEADCVGKYAAAAVKGVSYRIDALETQLRTTQTIAAVSLFLAAVLAGRVF